MIGNLLDGKKKMHRAWGLLLAAAVLFNTLPVGGLTAYASSGEAGLCEHHPEHTADCGYSEENNTPCGYVCRICPVADLTAALPDEVTEDNAEEVRAKLDEILNLYGELTEEEQEQTDLSRCYALQEALDAANASAPAQESTPDLELFGQKVGNGDSGEGWSYADGILTLENFHSDDSADNFIRILNWPMDFKIYLKGENSVKTSGTLCYGNVRGCMTVTGEPGASLSLAGKKWNDNNIVIRDVNVDVTTQGMIFLAQGMLIDNATVNINMSGSDGYIYTTHGGLTIQNGSNVTLVNASGDADYCVAANKAEITDSTLNITNPGGFGVYVTSLSQQASEYKVFITNSTITADAPEAGIHCEEEVSVTNSQVTNSGKFLIRSKKVITVDSSSAMEGITYEYFKSSTGAVYQVYGAHTLTSNFTVAENGSLVIPEGAALTIADGVTMENNGTMRIHEKASLTGAGVLTGNGNFQIDVNEDMISIPEGLVYTGKDYTDRITLEGTVTACGVEFTADTEGWTRSIEPEVVKDAGDYTVTYTDGGKSVSKTFTVAQSGTEFKGGIKACNGATETAEFTVGDTITVKAAPVAAGTASQKAAGSLLGGEPAAGQMALYVGDTIVSSAPVDADADGAYTMTANALDVADAAGGPGKVTLTAKFVGNGNMADAEGTVDVNIFAAAKVENGSATTYVGALADAFTDGNSGATVTLLADADLGSDCIRISGSRTFTLDLNGQTVKATDYGAFAILGGSLTIQDSGTGGRIESSNITIEVNGGTLSIQSGTVSGFYGVDISGGTVNISGGAISGEEIGLFLRGGGSIALSGGTISGRKAIQVEDNASATLKELLAAGCAYHRNNIPVTKAEGFVGDYETGEVPLDTKPAWLTGTVTVKECNHTGGLTPSGNGHQHGGACLCCGTNLPLEEHTLGTDGKCTACGAELVAKVNDTCYTNFRSAWSAAQAATTATVTLLADVNLGEQCITLSAGNITLTGSGRTLTGSGSQTIEVTGGELIVENVTVKNTNSESHTNSGIHVPSGKTAKVNVGEDATVTGSTGIYQESGSLAVSGTVEGTNRSGFGVRARGAALTVEEGAKISGGNEGIRHTVGGSLTINGGTINGRIAGVQITEDVTAKLNGGTFTGVYDAVAINGSGTTTMGNLLSTGYAIFKADGTAVERTKTSTGAGTFTVKECRHTGVAAASNKNGTHALNCPYCGHIDAAVNCAYIFGGTTGTCAACKDSVTVAVSGADVIYDGTGKEPGVTVMRDGTALAAGTDYTVAYNGNINAGKATVTVTIGNNQGTYTGDFIIGCATPTITWGSTSQELTYTGKSAVITAPTVTLVNGESFGGTISYSHKKQGEAVYKDGLPVGAGIYTIKAHLDAEGNYAAADSTNELTLTVKKADAEIMLGTAAYNVTYGDLAFPISGVTDTNPEADVRYEVTKGADVVSVENGTVTIRGAGEAEITVSLPESANYNAAESKTITVTVNKKSGYTVDTLNRIYFYRDGGTDSIDIAPLLPKDCGDVTCGEPAASGDVTYSAAPAVSGGKLSYTINSGNIDDGGSITVTVTTKNYEDIAVTVNVKLSDRIPVSLKTGTEVSLKNHVLTYGEPLSNLVFNEAEFVGADGKTVAGTLAWKKAAATPDAGTASAVWIFTPAEDKYVFLEGTAAITVNRATPVISAVPAVADRVYNPSVTLKDGDLSGGTATGADGNKLEGGWSWQSAGLVPNVNNGGYVAVFTPQNTTNYETAAGTVTVNVAKAVPYIAGLPAAAGITYGETLNDAALSGGTALYGDGAGQAGNGAGNTVAVAGTFTWKEPSTKPAAADSNVTEYAVVFTPSDTANYNSVEAKVKLTVNKAQNAPNMPGSAMEVPNSCKKAGDVPLPEGWEWQASDRDTALEAGQPVNAVAVYTGADKGSYEKETVTVAITRLACDHVAGDVLYTGAGEMAPTCTEDGLGHRECTKCGSVVESGVVVTALGHTYINTVTKEPTTGSEGIRTYTCTRCGHSYTESIPKLPDTGSNQPDNNRPGTGQPDDNRPGTGRPGNNQPDDNRPGTGNTEEAGPNAGIPFIKGENGKTGWDVIRAEEEQAEEGSIINVDMNGTTVVPGDIFDSIKGKDITITFDMGGGIIWSVNGKSIIRDASRDKAGDIDFSVKTGANTIPADIVNNVTGGRYSIRISLAYEGEFGFTAVLSISLGKENAGYTASLYYYNESTGELEFICADTVAEDGTVSLAFTHASDYLIAIDGEEEGGDITEPAWQEEQDGDSAGPAAESPGSGQAWSPWWFMAAGVLAIVMGISAFFVKKKKGKKD